MKLRNARGENVSVMANCTRTGILLVVCAPPWDSALLTPAEARLVAKALVEEADKMEAKHGD